MFWMTKVPDNNSDVYDVGDRIAVYWNIFFLAGKDYLCIIWTDGF